MIAARICFDYLIRYGKYTYKIKQTNKLDNIGGSSDGRV